MRMRVIIPLTYFHKFEMIVPVGMKTNIMNDYLHLDKVLRSEIVNINDNSPNIALMKMIEKLKEGYFPYPVTCRLYVSASMYLEETIIE